MDLLWRIELLGWLRAVPGNTHPHHVSAGVPASPSEPGVGEAMPNSRTIVRFRSRKCAALLAFLAYHRHRSHPREALIELLWPGCLAQSGRMNLRRDLCSLRRQLEPPGVPAGAVLLADRTMVQLNPAAAGTDVAAFEAALEAAAHAEAGPHQLLRLSQAIELYRGELLPGAFEEWVLLERQRLAELYLRALEQVIASLEQQGDLQRAILWARRGVAADPLREELQESLIRLLATTGQHEAARHQYQELERRLQRDAGVLPSPEVRALARSLCARKSPAAPEPAPAAAAPSPAPPPPAESMPLGTVTLLMVEPEDAPPAASAPETVLPSPSIGRGAGGEGRPAARESIARLRALCRERGGRELPAPGKLLAIVFPRASDALAAVREHLLRLACSATEGADTQQGIRNTQYAPRYTLRMALHTGEAPSGDELQHSPALQHALLLLTAAPPGQILLSETTAVLLSSDLPPSRELVDRGLYRLQPDLPPERLFQLVDPDATPLPLAPPQALPGHAGHLPLQFTRFFGREDEIARLCGMLESPPGARETRRPRIVTVTGPGGSGKTRLAAAAASRVQAWFPGGVWFVPMADLTDPRLIPDQILAALQLPRSPTLTPMEQLITSLSSRRFSGGAGAEELAPRGPLLLLDNLEHLLQEPADGGELVALQLLALLRERVPALTLLITSRRRLHLPGERQLALAPLPVPVECGKLRVESPAKTNRPDRSVPSDPSDLSTLNSQLSTLADCPSVALFVDRAQAVQADFQLTASNAAAVAQLCVRLAGIPLAIELAAARVGALTPAQILERLTSTAGVAPGVGRELLATRQRGIAARHRSMRAALDWSFQLLAPELQRFFARLSVFRGGWTVEAAERVSADPRALEYLEELRDRSWVISEVAEVGPQASASPDGGAAHDRRLAADHGGTAMRFRMLEPLREYAAEQLSDEERERAACQLAQYYLALAEQAEPQLKGPEQEAWFARLDAELDNLRAALDWSQSAAGDREWGLRLAGSLGRFWLVRGYWAEGLERLQALLVEDHKVDGPYEHPLAGERGWVGLPGSGRPSLARAKAQMWASDLASGLGDLAAWHAFATESLATARALGDRRGIASALNNLANLAISKSDLQRAHSLATQSLAISREVGEAWQAALSLLLLATVATNQSDHPSTQALAAESLAIWRELGDIRGIAMALQRLGDAASKQGDDKTARVLLQEGLEIYQRLRDPWGACITRWYLGECAQREGDFGAARAHFEGSLAIARAANMPNETASILLNMAELARGQGEAIAARALLEESLANFRKVGSRPGAATCLTWLARLAQDQGDGIEAARLFEAAEAEYTPADALPGPADRREHDALRAAVRAARDETVGVP